MTVLVLGDGDFSFAASLLPPSEPFVYIVSRTYLFLVGGASIVRLTEAPDLHGVDGGVERLRENGWGCRGCRGRGECEEAKKKALCAHHYLQQFESGISTGRF